MKQTLRIQWIHCGMLLLLASCISEQVEPKIDCPTLEVAVDQLQNSQCDDATGSFTLVVDGGVAPYRFEADFNTNSTGVFSGVSAGTYSISVIDANSCTSQIDVAVPNESGLVIDQVVTTNAGCGSGQGSLEMVVSGGEEPYSYSIDNGTPQSSNLFPGLLNDEYELTAIDATGCEITQTVQVLTGVSYQNSIKGIIESNCAISGCHNGSVSPDLRTFNSIQSNANRIKARTANRSMPRGRTLTQTQIDLIACWVDDGALDN